MAKSSSQAGKNAPKNSKLETAFELFFYFGQRLSNRYRPAVCLSSKGSHDDQVHPGWDLSHVSIINDCVLRADTRNTGTCALTPSPHLQLELTAKIKRHRGDKRGSCLPGTHHNERRLSTLLITPTKHPHHRLFFTPHETEERP